MDEPAARIRSCSFASWPKAEAFVPRHRVLTYSRTRSARSWSLLERRASPSPRPPPPALTRRQCVVPAHRQPRRQGVASPPPQHPVDRFRRLSRQFAPRCTQRYSLNPSKDAINENAPSHRRMLVTCGHGRQFALMPVNLRHGLSGTSLVKPQSTEWTTCGTCVQSIPTTGISRMDSNQRRNPQ